MSASSSDDDGDLLRELGKQLPWERPDAERREAVRAGLLVRASEGDAPPTQRRWLLAGGAFVAGVAAAAAVALVIGRAPAPAVVEHHAQIEASAAAELEHTVVASEETVRVRAGTVRLAVGAATAGTRVLVRTGDATIEGVGAYEVSVRHDALAAVTVTSGSARLSVDGQRAVFLAAGESWTAAIVTADVSPVAPLPTLAPRAPDAVAAPSIAPPIASAPSVARDAPTNRAPATSALVPVTRERHEARAIPPAAEPPPRELAPAPAVEPQPAVTASEPVAPPAVTGKTPTEQHFERGWSLLRAGKYAEAASALGAAADAGAGELAADARYFQATAFVKAGRKTEAERAYLAFLDRAPTSLRRGRAAIALARLIAERGDLASARRWFESALTDPDPSIAAAARAGLVR